MEKQGLDTTETSLKSIIFENPNCEPLDKVVLEVSIGGVTQKVPALDELWVESRYFLCYEAPQLTTPEGVQIPGAKEHWMQITTFVNEDIKWLLSLPYFRFWSNITYNENIVEMLMSVLLETPTYYQLPKFPDDEEMRKLLSKLLRNVYVIYGRLFSNTESPTEYMSPIYQAELLYDYYIFSIPILFDFCQHFGRSNKKAVAKMVASLFKLQPEYSKDLERIITFIVQVFRSVEQKFEDSPVPLAGELVHLSERGGASREMSLSSLEETIVYLLDTVSTLAIFYDVYPQVIEQLDEEDFTYRIVSLYENTIPEIYKRLPKVTSKEPEAKFIELKRLLDVTRLEILTLYRIITYSSVEKIMDAPEPLPDEKIAEIVDTFINLLTSVIGEKLFVTDYHRLYPVDADMRLLSLLYPAIDTIKRDYILSSVHAKLETATASNVPNQAVVAGTNNAQKIQEAANKIPETKLVQLMAEVKEILHELGEGFIMKCLEHYNYNSESVINAFLEGSLPSHIADLDPTLPYIPEETEEAACSSNSQLPQDENIDNLCKMVEEEVIIATEDKKQEEYRNLKHMLEDKSHIKEASDIYQRYGYIADEYDDEYDDTYDSHEIGTSVQDDTVENDRPFTTPRILRMSGSKKNITTNKEDEDDDESEEEEETSKSKSNNFVEDPAVLRERAAQKRLAKMSGSKGLPPRNRNVTGVPSKDKDATDQKTQDKSVTKNREFKNIHKSSQGNHNRRAGAAWKKRQGMFPS